MSRCPRVPVSRSPVNGDAPRWEPGASAPLPTAPFPTSGAEGVNSPLSIGLYFLKKFIRFLQGDQKRVLAFPHAPSKQNPALKIQNFLYKLDSIRNFSHIKVLFVLPWKWCTNNSLLMPQKGL